MDWLKDLFIEHSALQAVVVISLISTIGIGLGKIRFFGISLGTAFIFFVGILAGHLGLTLDPAMLAYAESFGLIIFVYALGLQVGPGFFSSLRAGGLRLVSPAIAVVAVGTLPLDPGLKSGAWRELTADEVAYLQGIAAKLQD